MTISCYILNCFVFLDIGVGKARAKTLIEAAEHSVGSKEGAVSARMEIRILLEDYESRNTRLNENTITLQIW